jgi:hypothetical protein
VVGAIPRQALTFTDAISNIELSPVFLRELRKAVAAGKKKKALAASEANATSASALKRHSGVGSEALNSRDSLQLHVSKGKAKELFRSDCPSEPASRRLGLGICSVTGPRPRARRANQLPEQPATWFERGWAGVLSDSGRTRRPATVK